MAFKGPFQTKAFYDSAISGGLNRRSCLLGATGIFKWTLV